jgi:hypothetical protein
MLLFTKKSKGEMTEELGKVFQLTESKDMNILYAGYG